MCAKTIPKQTTSSINRFASVTTLLPRLPTVFGTEPFFGNSGTPDKDN